MTSLTQVAIITRKIIKYGILSVIGIIILRLLILSGVSIYRKIYPPPPPPATVTWGRLPKLTFAQKQLPANITFTLETAEGGFPKLPVQSKVFFMPKLSANLLSLDSAKQKAQSMGYNPEGEAVSTTTYRFRHPQAPSTLEMNIVLGIFSINYDLKSDPTPLDARPPVPEVAASNIRSILSSANLLPQDLTGPTTYDYLKLQEGNFVSAISLSEANLVKIHFFRKAYDSLPVVTTDPKTANVWFTVGGIGQKEKSIVAAEYHYFPVDESQFSTYPIKTSEEAWNELGSGTVYFANTGQHKEGDNIKIRRIYLAYFDPKEPANFLQPIIVLDEGVDGGFMAYVPAVTADYYGD
ncbi:MAG: hypothetical protein Q8P91_02020 [bacterium]|nr:hypothetical protein [bacterium]